MPAKCSRGSITNPSNLTGNNSSFSNGLLLFGVTGVQAGLSQRSYDNGWGQSPFSSVAFVGRVYHRFQIPQVPRRAAILRFGSSQTTPA